MEAEAIRPRAERCRRLARSIYNIEVTADLEAYTQHLDLCAAALEVCTRPNLGETGEQHRGLR
jgi:hypothetical protein